jgi:hypothetical protein
VPVLPLRGWIKTVIFFSAAQLIFQKKFVKKKDTNCAEML